MIKLGHVALRTRFQPHLKQDLASRTGAGVGRRFVPEARTHAHVVLEAKLLVKAARAATCWRHEDTGWRLRRVVYLWAALRPTTIEA
jgi:hypothetical protein